MKRIVRSFVFIISCFVLLFVMNANEKVRAEEVKESEGYNRIHMDEFLEMLSKDKDISTLPEVVIAVLDTGINTDHPWFENRFLYDENGKIIGENFTSDKSSTEWLL